MKFVRPLSAALVALSFLAPGLPAGASTVRPTTAVVNAPGSFFCSVFPWWCS